MTLEEAKQHLVQAWGTLGSSWGVSRTMAQVHALLLVSPEPMSTEEIMEALQISRGNVNMNVRDLMDWGIVRKILKTGERKEYFEAEKDIWKVAMQVAKERKKRELEPILRVLEEISTIEADITDPKVKQFAETVDNLKKFAGNADQSLNAIIKAEESWFWGGFLKMFK
ncbi:DNA-binding transcriptional regulator GbsR, MarR family [Pseudarcicella hirudinis]|uniref:HTH-type transcriptional regulator n=1 Tax=Pseudarcicella hirudinis TaxID=1079859 RepID=A0A1I5X1G4_9BACT|nr:MarR family transcriptional regulator [Pseudarcicella hirudinis]SFQ25833.1 DNA-binding transcriptional regulator GbsR, MarR family [Pseudarcicella hirudinis]